MDSADHLAHALVPMSLAVTLVRAKSQRLRPSAASSDLDSIATFIAATVPIYEYSDDPSVLPRMLLDSLSGGLFRNGGRELHFLDGRPTITLLAVQAEDVARVIAMLNQAEPQPAAGPATGGTGSG